MLIKQITDKSVRGHGLPMKFKITFYSIPHFTEMHFSNPFDLFCNWHMGHCEIHFLTEWTVKQRPAFLCPLHIRCYFGNLCFSLLSIITMYDFISRTIISETFGQGETTMYLKVDNCCVVHIRFHCLTQPSVVHMRRHCLTLVSVSDLHRLWRTVWEWHRRPFIKWIVALN